VQWLITFLSAQHHKHVTDQYHIVLLDNRYMCEQLAHNCYVVVNSPMLNLQSLDVLTITITSWHLVVVSHSVSMLVSINKVNLCLARLIPAKVR